MSASGYPSDVDYPRRVVVDDTDPRIKYDSGDWALDKGSFDSITNYGAPYNGTMHGTASGTATFSFEFEGEFVQVRGAKDNRKIARAENTAIDDNNLLPKWTCQVDGSEIKVTPYRANVFERTHNMLCEQGRLSRGKHKLTVSVTVDNPETQMFWLDKIEYAPLPGANIAKEVLKIDSSDLSIRLDNNTGSWKNLGSFNGTGTTGASASFTFDGTSVALYGFNEGSDESWLATSGRYHIDSGNDESFEIAGSKSLPGLPDNKTDYQHQLWFTTPNLAPGTHEMVLAFTGVFKKESIQWLSIDYFYVTASEGSQLNPATPDGKGGEGSNNSNGSNSNGSNGTNQENKKSNVGAIAGGVAGGVVALLLLGLALFFFLRKRKRSTGNANGFDPQNMSYNAAAPLAPNIYAPSGPSSSYTHSSYPASTVMSPSDNAASLPVAGAGSFSYSPSVGGSTNMTSSSARGTMVVNNPGGSAGPSTQNWADMKGAQRDAIEAQSRPIPRQHEDSGIRYNQPPIVDVPPTYTEA